jgi:hypothetical protein
MVAKRRAHRVADQSIDDAGRRYRSDVHRERVSETDNPFPLEASMTDAEKIDAMARALRKIAQMIGDIERPRDRWIKDIAEATLEIVGEELPNQ